MADDQSTLESLVAELAQMRATLATQNETITRQEAAIAALQGKLDAADDDHSRSAAIAPDTHDGHDYTTSRRGLLRGAAAATAAAAVATVAVGGAQQAHAAPLTDGSSMLVGTANTATLTTALNDTAGTASYMLEVTSTSSNSTSAAIHATSPSAGMGLLGATATGSGVQGTSSGGAGVYGIDSSAGVGVEGDSAIGVGVVGFATAQGGWGVLGASQNSVDVAALGTGLMVQVLQGSVGIPAGTFSGGASIRDANGDLWLCVAGDGSTNGTWVKVAHLAPGATSGGATTYLSKPIRLFDSRPGQPAASNPGHQLQPNTSTKVQVAGVTYNTVTVPSPLAGAIGNVTVLNASGGAFVEIVPSGAGFTGASTANIGGPGQIVANGFNVALSGGALDIYVAGVAVDVIIDLFAIVA